MISSASRCSAETSRNLGKKQKTKNCHTSTRKSSAPAEINERAVPVQLRKVGARFGLAEHLAPDPETEPLVRIDALGQQPPRIWQEL